MQVIDHCNTLFRSWLTLQRMENRNIFTEVSTQLEDNAKDFIIQLEWQHNLRIDLPPPLESMQFHVDYVYISSLSVFFIRSMIVKRLCASLLYRYRV
jgi:hypothetical protein